MTTCWTIRDRNGELLPHFACTSALEVARKVVPGRYDAFRLHVSSSYRQLFDRAVKQILAREGWQIVRTTVRARPGGRRDAPIERRQGRRVRHQGPMDFHQHGEKSGVERAAQ